MTYHDWVSCVLNAQPDTYEYAVKKTVRAASHELRAEPPLYFQESLRTYLSARRALDKAAQEVLIAAELCGVRKDQL